MNTECLISTFLSIKNYSGTSEAEKDKFEFPKIKIFYVAKEAINHLNIKIICEKILAIHMVE